MREGWILCLGLLASLHASHTSFALVIPGHMNMAIQRYRYNVLFSTTISSTDVSSDTSKASVGFVVGDTKGAALLLEDVAISRGSNQILRDVNWRVERRVR